ncbi:MAG: helix-turn-helix domain-containing protein [Shewanella sp.]
MKYTGTDMTKKLAINDYEQEILDWIEKELPGQPRLDDLAAAIGYSKRHIQQHFQQIHGLTIGSYILNRRLYIASVLLRMTKLSVSEIASQLHFCNHNNFCRSFRNKLNCSPLAFRSLQLHLLPSLQLPQVNYRKPIAYSITTLENTLLVGTTSRYEEKFSASNSIGGQIKLQRLRAWFQDSRGGLAIASEVDRDTSTFQSRHGLIMVNCIVGNIMPASQVVDIAEGVTTYLPNGCYLCCPFYGLFSDYATHNIDIYRHLLPQLKLKRREGYDIELFHFTRNIFDEHPKVSCEHYIPIESPTTVISDYAK